MKRGGEKIAPPGPRIATLAPGDDTSVSISASASFARPKNRFDGVGGARIDLLGFAWTHQIPEQR
jgi:hypothetical protein